MAKHQLPAPEGEEDETRQPFIEHLRDLRTSLRNACIAVVIAGAASFYFSKDVYELLKVPLTNAWAAAELGELSMYSSGLPDPFWVYLRVALYCGLFMASPVVFYQIWRFIAPGLYAKEKRMALPFAFFSGVFFVSGGLFCYYVVLPAAFRFFLAYSSESLTYLPDIREYLSLVSKLMVGFGIAFELPLLVFFLSYVGLVTHKKLWDFNKYFVVIAFTMSALLTPPDLYSQTFMALPLIVLYNLSIGVSWLVTRGRSSDVDQSGQDSKPNE